MSNTCENCGGAHPTWPSRDRLVQMYILRHQAAVLLFNAGSHLASAVKLDAEEFFVLNELTVDDVPVEFGGTRLPQQQQGSAPNAPPNGEERSRFGRIMRGGRHRPDPNTSEENTDEEGKPNPGR